MSTVPIPPSPCLGTAAVRVDTPCALGEGPGWDGPREEVRWLDILAGELHRAGADGGRHRVTPLGRKTSYAALTTDGDYLLVAENRLSRLDPQTGEPAPSCPSKPTTR